MACGLIRSNAIIRIGQVNCGSCESCITYSSSIITYRPSSWRLSAIHDAISTMILQYQHWSLLLFSLVQPLSPGRRKLHTCLPGFPMIHKQVLVVLSIQYTVKIEKNYFLHTHYLLDNERCTNPQESATRYEPVKATPL